LQVLQLEIVAEPRFSSRDDLSRLFVRRLAGGVEELAAQEELDQERAVSRQQQALVEVLEGDEGSEKFIFLKSLGGEIDPMKLGNNSKKRYCIFFSNVALVIRGPRGCQIFFVVQHTKIRKIWKVLKWKMLVFFMAIWYI
jgi:hypothetical protein